MISEVLTVERLCAMPPSAAAALLAARRLTSGDALDGAALTAWLAQDPAHGQAWVRAQRAVSAFDDAQDDDIVSAMLLAAPLAPSQTLIRMGTLAPKGSRWEQILLEMGAKWKQATNGRLTLRLYAGGEQSDEPEMVQKMRISTRNEGEPRCGISTACGISRAMRRTSSRLTATATPTGSGSSPR